MHQEILRLTKGTEMDEVSATVQFCKAVVGSVIYSVEIDPVNEVVTFELDTGVVKLAGNRMQLYFNLATISPAS